MALKKKVTAETAAQKETQVAKDATVVEETKVEKEVIEAKAEVVEEVVEAKAEVAEEVIEAKAEVVEEVNSKPANTDVATTEKPARTAVSAPAKQSEMVQASAGFSQEAAMQGFEGLEVGGFGTFPTIVIGTSGVFELDGEEEEFKTVVGRLETTKALYLCKQKGVQDGPTAFTYDQVNLNGEVDKCLTVADLKNAWEEEGEEMEIKKYLEVLVEVVDEDDDKVGQFFIVKVAPSSINKFNGIPFLASRRGTPLNSVVVEFGIGKRRESKGGNKYTPWTFKDVTNQYAE